MESVIKGKFFIFGQGRSGSTLLQRLLDAHPEIRCHGELFHDSVLLKKGPYKKQLIEIFPNQYLSYCRQRDSGLIFGFKILCYQFRKREKRLRDLFSGGWKIIHLRRKDIFSRCISELVGIQSGVFFNKENAGIQGKTIMIKPELLINYIENSLIEKEFEDKILENISQLEVNYEDMLENQENWPATMEKIFHYLGTYNTPVTSSLKKTYPRPYSEIVSNYDELIEAVKNRKINISV